MTAHSAAHAVEATDRVHGGAERASADADHRGPAEAIAVRMARDGDRRRLDVRQVATLQRLAGNRAVAGLLAPPIRATSVQRDVDDFMRAARLGKSTSGSIGTTAEKRAITAHFFPGTSDQKALVIGGVHGSELSGIAVAEELIKRLSAPGARQPFFSVVIVPSLFPDNVARRRKWEKTLTGPMTPKAYAEARDKADDPGRVTPGEIDPNRQMPAVGKDFDPKNPKDARGRKMEAENQALLELIRQFSPVRVASLHAIKEVGRAGVFADPHPAAVGSGSAADKSLAADTDALALDMARKVAGRGGHVAGNKLGTADETSLYPGQNPKLSADQIEKENKKGTTFGQWAPSRGIGVITIEMPEQHDTASPVTDPGRPVEIESRAEALEEIFLGPPPGSSTAACDPQDHRGGQGGRRGHRRRREGGGPGDCRGSAQGCGGFRDRWRRREIGGPRDISRARDPPTG